MYYGNNEFGTSGLISMLPPDNELSQYSELPGYEKNKIAKKLAIQHLIEGPLSISEKTPLFFFRFWLYPNAYWYQTIPKYYGVPAIYHWVIWFLAAIGGIYAIASNWRKTSMIWLYFIMVSMPYLAAFYVERYKFVLVPFQLILIGYLLSKIKIKK